MTIITYKMFGAGKIGQCTESDTLQEKIEENMSNSEAKKWIQERIDESKLYNFITAHVVVVEDPEEGKQGKPYTTWKAMATKGQPKKEIFRQSKYIVFQPNEKKERNKESTDNNQT